MDTVAVHTPEEAFRTLERSRIDLIISTVAFDDSRMIEFLEAIKRTATAGGIPFLCCRALSVCSRTSWFRARAQFPCNAALLVSSILRISMTTKRRAFCVLLCGLPCR
jgi:hypothetical protein